MSFSKSLLSFLSELSPSYMFLINSFLLRFIVVVRQKQTCDKSFTHNQENQEKELHGRETGEAHLETKGQRLVYDNGSREPNTVEIKKGLPGKSSAPGLSISFYVSPGFTDHFSNLWRLDFNVHRGVCMCMWVEVVKQ